MNFREKKLPRSVTERAKALLQCDGTFFTGENGHRRFVDGRYIESTDEPSCRQFVQKALVASPEGKLTVPGAFHRYYQFCSNNQMEPLTSSEFKRLVTEVIREQFNVGLRHDVIGANGKHGLGWVGIDCCRGNNMRPELRFRWDDDGRKLAGATT